MIYLTNCRTSQPAPEAIEAMLPYLKEKFYFPGNFIKSGTEAKQDLEKI